MTMLPRMLKLLYEMETSDPDDFLTLCWLLDHPAVHLVGVCMTPGSKAQVQLARWAANQCGRADLPIGSFNIDHAKDCVSGWHYKVYGDEVKKTAPTGTRYGPELILQLAHRHPDLTVLTGSPPKNLGTAHQLYGELRLDRWVCQGGFAGDPVVPPEHRLEKFAGRETCATFNLGGAPKLALPLIASEHIRRRVFVSKNVCHGVKWTKTMAQDVRARFRSKGNLKPVRQGAYLMMYGADKYLDEHADGKAVHDLLAAAVAVDETVCQLREVDLYRKHGEWGSVLKDNTRSWISIAHDYDRFLDVLTATM